MDNQKFGRFIRDLRKKANMTQKELGEKLNVTDKAVSKWERGLGFPDITIINLLAETFGITASEVLNAEIGKKETVDVEKAVQEAVEKVTKEKERKENILPNPPLPKGGDEGEEGGDFSNRKPAKKKHELTQSDIDRMQAPADGHPRNLSGLLDNLRLYHIPPSEQYAIVLKSNYGEIGGKVWKGFGVIRASAGKIKLPGHYLLSVLNN